MKKRFTFVVAVFFCCCVLLSVGERLALASDKPFLLSPVVGWYFPTDGKTKDAFGDNWFSIGVTLNFEALGWKKSSINSGNVKLYPFFGYIHASEGNNAAHIVPIGLEARWNLAREEDATIKPYWGLGAALYGVKFHDRDAGVESNWRGTFGGRLMAGTDITKWFNIEAAYHLISDVKGYDFSGFSVRGKVTFWF